MSDHPTEITPIVRARFLEALEAQEAKGVETYGRTLSSHNGRDAALDAWEELVDFAKYLTQLQTEHDDRGHEIEGLRAEVDELRHQAGLPLKYGGGIGP